MNFSCGDPQDNSAPLDLPPITWRGQFVEFGTDVDTEICPQTLPAMDEYMEGIAEHVRSDTPYPIRYYYLDNELRDYGFGCVEGSYGCAGRRDGNSILGGRVLNLRHEFIHASSSLHHRVLEEGLAVYLGTDLQWAGTAEPSNIQAAFDSVDGNAEALPNDLYPVAGHFVSFLVDKYGLPKTVSMVNESEPGMTSDELALLALDHFGRDLREDIAEYETAGPGCEVAEFSPMWFECELAPPSIPIFSCGPGDTHVPVEVSLDCADGASGVQDGMIWKDILIDAQTPTLALIDLHEGHPVEFIVKGCGQGCGTTLERISSGSEQEELIQHAFQLEEGLNLIRVLKPVEAQGTVRFSIGMSCF